jgi:hypothetical protein
MYYNWLGLCWMLVLLLGCTRPPQVSSLASDSTQVLNEPPVVARIPFYIDKKLRTEDCSYEASIRSVQLFPKPEEAGKYLSSAVIPLEQSVPLVLEFDELTAEAHSPFHVKLLHCNADWTLSALNEIEYLRDYNDFTITEQAYGENTRIPYIHYRFELPKVKISGNYVVMVHREGNIKDLLLTRRFMVYESLIEIQARIVPSQGGLERRTHQQLDFTIGYRQYALINPSRQVSVSIRQNQNWQRVVKGLAPYVAHEQDKHLEFTFFDLENNLPGGSEFRFFDIRTLRSKGMQVDRLEISPDSNRVYLQADRPRKQEAYASQPDHNGAYIIDHYESGNGNIQGDYAEVYFTLRSPQPVAGTVYLLGAMTNWQALPEGRMDYDAARGVYMGKMLLKQGVYDYQYAVKKGNALDLDEVEGSHFETENLYELMVYYRPPAARNDLIIGYMSLQANPRR